MTKKTPPQQPVQASGQEGAGGEVSVRPKVFTTKKVKNADEKKPKSSPQKNPVILLDKLNDLVDTKSIYQASSMPTFLSTLEQLSRIKKDLVDNDYIDLADIVKKIQFERLLYKDFFKIAKLLHASEIFYTPLPESIKIKTIDQIMDSLINGLFDFSNETHEIYDTFLISESILLLSDTINHRINKSDEQKDKIKSIFEKLITQNTETLKKISPFYFEKLINLFTYSINTTVSAETIKEILKELEPVIAKKINGFNPPYHVSNNLCKYFVNLDILGVNTDYILDNDLFTMLLEKFKSSDIKAMYSPLARKTLSSIGLLLKKSKLTLNEKDAPLIEDIIKQIDLKDIETLQGSFNIKLFSALSHISKFLPEMASNEYLNRLEQKISNHLKKNLDSLNEEDKIKFPILNAEFLNLQQKSFVDKNLLVEDFFDELVDLEQSIENSSRIIERLCSRNLLYSQSVTQLTNSFLKKHVPFIQTHFDKFSLTTKLYLTKLPPSLLKCDKTLTELILSTIDVLSVDKELIKNKTFAFLYLKNIYNCGNFITRFDAPLKIADKFYSDYKSLKAAEKDPSDDKSLETNQLLILALFFIQIIIVKEAQGEKEKSTKYLKKRVEQLFEHIKTNRATDTIGAHEALKYNLIASFIDPSFKDDTVYFSSSRSSFEKEFKQALSQQKEAVAFPYKEEAIIDGLSPVDMLFEKQKVVCEINGQHHFFGEYKENQKSSTLIRDHILKSKGYEIYNVDIKDLKISSLSSEALEIHINNLIALLKDKDKDKDKDKKTMKEKSSLKF